MCGLISVSCSAVFTHRVLFPEPRTIPLLDSIPPYTSHPVTAPDGSTFDVWRLEAPTPRGRLLLCHGYYANRYQVLWLADGLRQRGYEVLLMELRGHGSRPGPCTLGLKESEDGAAVLQWARARETTQPLPIGVLGFSMGASVVCQVARRVPEVRAIVVDSIYARFFPVLRQRIKERYGAVAATPMAWLTWLGLHAALRTRLISIDPVTLASQLRQPLFAISGGADQRVDPRLSEEFYARWAGPKAQWSEPDVIHVGMFARHPEEYCNRVARFFDQALAQTPASVSSTPSAQR